MYENGKKILSNEFFQVWTRHRARTYHLSIIIGAWLIAWWIRVWPWRSCAASNRVILKRVKQLLILTEKTWKRPMPLSRKFSRVLTRESGRTYHWGTIAGACRRSWCTYIRPWGSCATFTWVSLKKESNICWFLHKMIELTQQHFERAVLTSSRRESMRFAINSSISWNIRSIAQGAG